MRQLLSRMRLVVWERLAFTSAFKKRDAQIQLTKIISQCRSVLTKFEEFCSCNVKVYWSTFVWFELADKISIWYLKAIRYVYVFCWFSFTRCTCTVLQLRREKFILSLLIIMFSALMLTLWQGFGITPLRIFTAHYFFPATTWHIIMYIYCICTARFRVRMMCPRLLKIAFRDNLFYL